MSAGREAINSALATASAMLQQVRAELAAGNDVTPSELFAMEALLTQASVAGATSIEIKDAIERLLPEGSVLNIAERDQHPVIKLKLWQRRAPVVPST